MRLQLSDDDVLTMGKLAVLASVPVGMGVLHHDPTLKFEDIALDVRDDFNPGLFIDYYKGRMVKFRAWKKDGGWDFPDQISHEYQSWIRTYPSYSALAEAAQNMAAPLVPVTGEATHE